MPQAIIAAITPYISSVLFAIGGNALAVAATAVVASALVYGGLVAASYLVQAALAPAKPEAPKPEDGKYNLKQSVPPLVYILGRVKKAGDYAFLEEKGGRADHIQVDAAHRIQGYVEHYLHDEKIALTGTSVTTPAHFGSYVSIETRSGLKASTAYASMISRYPTIWTADHRGDGLATVCMSVFSVPIEAQQRVFPQGMPSRSSVIDGALLFDPRQNHNPLNDDTWAFSRNIPLERLWHLTHPVGGKLNLDDMYLPDWAHAADVADQDVTNRAGGMVKRYHGGLWFRANNDPVQIGRLLDQAGELVIYERADGAIGVHAGEDVETDVRLTADDIISISYDANKRRATNVLAVRGRYTDPTKGYNTADAAIYGDPYPSDDERTKTIENQVVQDHNHRARMEKLAYIRANAPRVKILAHYEPARQVPYRRFITVHVPPKMTEARLEITGRPSLSLRNLTYSFDGIIVPPALYPFDAATEEGVPGANVVPIVREDVPAPANFLAAMRQEAVGGGSTAAYVLATFDLQQLTFQYELEWQPTAGGATQSVLGVAGALELRSTYLADGVQYRFRARTWSAGTSSDWTAYQTLTATADPAAPGVVTGVGATGGAGQISFTWTAPNSANYVGARLYTNATNTMTGATLRGTEFGAPSTADSRIITGLTAGTYFGFVVAINGSGVEAAAVATGSRVVT